MAARVDIIPGGDGAQPTHLIVLLHGMHGGSWDFNNMVDMMVDGDCPAGALVLRPTSNQGLLRTNAGILAVAARAFQQIRDTCSSHPELTSVSVLGHSFGGVYGRAVLQLMAEHGIIPGGGPDAPTPARLRPATFCTVASPFLGIRRPQWGGPRVAFNSLFHVVAPVIAGHSGTEMLLEDPDLLLHRLATDETYLRPLRLFKRRVLYANVFHDLQVPFCTAAVEASNPHRGGGGDVPHRSHELAPFPSIIAAVVRIGSIDPAVDLAAAAKTDTLAFRRDMQGVALREMVAALNTVGWEKYHCLLSPSAHHQIVANSVWTFGRDVPAHIVDQMLG